MPGLAAVDHLVHLLEERHGVEVLAAAELVRHPLAFLARVVEVEHRRDGVHAYAVDVVLAQPEERVREQEVAHLVAAVVEDQRAPVRVGAAARVLVLVERGSVEAREREVVAREVRGHPVEDHADAVLVHPVDELAQLVGGAPAGRGREVAGHLVAPRARERVRHHRQQLDVGEAHVVGVGRQLVGQLEVGQRPLGLAGGRAATSRGAPRRSTSAARAAWRPRRAREPLRVAPLVLWLGDDRGGLRRLLGLLGVRVGLQPQLAALGEQLELVARAGLDARPGRAPRPRPGPSSAWRAGGRPTS